MLVVAMLQLAGNLLANMLGSWAEEMTATWLLPTTWKVGLTNNRVEDITAAWLFPTEW